MEQSIERKEKEIVGKDEEKPAVFVRSRRVGSVTFGIALICYGVLFLIHIFVPELPYHVIFRCWPVCFILLGVEVLVEDRKSRNSGQSFRYDFPAVLMLGSLLLFAMVMAAADVAYADGSWLSW